MTLLKPTLVLRRLLVVNNGAAVFDQRFDPGFNVIAGDNGGGKTTIADFIFYALGGATPDWHPEAEKCDFVYAELQINEQQLTLRREIEAAQSRPMDIYWGPMTDALKAELRHWERFPFASRGNKRSFTDVLFEVMGIPTVREEMAAQVTIHQLLRLVYVDQFTPVSKLFKAEDFDPKITKEATADLALGLYDPRLYELRNALGGAQGELSKVTTELNNVRSILGPEEQTATAASLEQERANRLNDQRHIQLQIKAIGDAEDGAGLRAAPADEELPLEQIRRSLRQANEHARYLRDTVQRLELERSDSEMFIAAMEARLAAVEESRQAGDLLGTVGFTTCPACHAKLQEAERGVCVVCRAPADAGAKELNLLQIRHELSMQIRESRLLQETRDQKILEVEQELPRAEEQAARLQERLDSLELQPSTRRERALTELSRQEGYLARQVEELERRIALARRVEALSERKADLSAEITRLRDQIEAFESKHKKRRMDAYGLIAELTLEMLREDIPTEEGFQEAKELRFSFGDDYLEVDGRSNFAASSMVFLKNCFHLAVLVASTQREYFNYPRFSLMDNIEDKGMQPERSRRFQRLALEYSKEIEVVHQLIITTSLVAPELRDSAYQRGDYLTKTNKSLRLGTGRKPE